MTTSTQLQNIRSRVRERLGLSSADTGVTDAILTQLINAAERKIALIHDWPWLIEEDADWTALTANQSKYAVTVPVDAWRKTLSIVVDTDQVLTPKQPQDIHRYAQQTGFPYFYAISGTDIYIYPTPDTAYSVKHTYVKELTAMSGDTDVATTEDWAIDLLVEGAAILVAKRLKDPELARMMQEEYALTLDSMRDEVRRTRQLPLPRHRTDIGWP